MSLQRASRFVVITGASTGIGAGCAIGCAQQGMTVFAGVRNLQAGEALQAKEGAAIIPLQLDVTDDESIKRAADTVRQRVGGAGLAGLINNAGIAIGSPLEVIPLSQLRKQLEVNVIGQIAVTQAFLPLLRQAHGRIVNMGSIAGRGTIPMMGPYSASKFAMEALTDALRLELYPWGIQVSIIEPGAIATPIWDKADALDLSPYEHTDYFESVRWMQEYAIRNGKKGLPAETVGKLTWHALTTPMPRVRYAIAGRRRLRLPGHQEQGPADDDRTDTGPDGDVDGLFVLYR